jgi:hypothetical protein
MKRPTCRTCHYWLGYPEFGEGQCRRLPPTQQYISDGNTDGGVWIYTNDYEWCGEHQDFPKYIESLKESNK